MGSKDIKYRVGFSIIPGFGRIKLGRLESHFGNLEDAWQAARDDLKHADLDNGTILATVSWRPKISLEAENVGDYTAL